jgi:hypothetical protein
MPKGMYESPYSVYVIMKQNYEIMKGVLSQKSGHVTFFPILGESMKNVATHLNLYRKLVIVSQKLRTKTN